MDTEAEIVRLRDRIHDHANLLTGHTGQLEALHELVREAPRSINEKLDAIHLSLKEDNIDAGRRIDGIEVRVAANSEAISRIRGVGATVVVAAPIISGLAGGLLFFLLEKAGG